jgi:hypothetical protein
MSMFHGLSALSPNCNLQGSLHLSELIGGLEFERPFLYSRSHASTTSMDVFVTNQYRLNSLHFIILFDLVSISEK